MLACDIAWAAGLFEGEGYIGHGRHYTLRLTLSSTDEDVVRRFHAVVACGAVAFPPRNHGRKHKGVWVWETRKQPDVHALMEAFLPYLGARRTARWLALLEERTQHRQASFTVAATMRHGVRVRAYKRRRHVTEAV